MNPRDSNVSVRYTIEFKISAIFLFCPKLRTEIVCFENRKHNPNNHYSSNEFSQHCSGYNLCVCSLFYCPPRSTVLFASLNSLSTGLNNTVLLMILRPINQQTVN